VAARHSLWTSAGRTPCARLPRARRRMTRWSCLAATTSTVGARLLSSRCGLALVLRRRLGTEVMAGASSVGSRLVKTRPGGGREAGHRCGCGNIARGNASLVRRAHSPAMASDKPGISPTLFSSAISRLLETRFLSKSLVLPSMTPLPSQVEMLLASQPPDMASAPPSQH
jgi:hypothetical protein